jgi:hypothetical protein
MSHGHVVPFKGSQKARCGGPSICGECAAELASISIDSKQELQQMVLHHPHPLVRRLATLILQLHTLGALK